MKEILKKYVNQEIGINVQLPNMYKKAKLVSVFDDYFSVFEEDTKLTTHFNFQVIMNIKEAEGGIRTGIIFGKNYPLLIEVNHLIVYSGFVGMSFW